MASSLVVSVPRRVALVAPARAAARPTAARASYKVTFVSDKGTSRDVVCGDDEFLLDAADAGGVDLPASCRGGCFESLHVCPNVAQLENLNH